MNRGHKLAFAVCIFWACMVGCGVRPASPNPPENGACNNILISGVLKDSLTGQPVDQGQVVLESGAQLAQTKLYNFSPAQQVATGSDGTFQICASAIASPLVIVATALDSSSNAYPPFVAPVSGTANLGTIPMGGCYEKCAFEGQQQTSLPATIKGAITTVPVAETGTVAPLYSMNALDGSNNIWNLTVPILNASQSYMFTTAISECTGGATFCASYTFVVPSQKPVWPVKSGYMQQAGAPVYSIYAAAPSCTPPFMLNSFEQDGQSPLLATPGAKLLAGEIGFSGCK